MTMRPLIEIAKSLYEEDEHAWLLEQVEHLESDNSKLDRKNLIQYLEEMAIAHRRELKSRLKVLLQHLLKVVVQPSKLSQSWIYTIVTQQNEINDLLKSMPSIKQYVPEIYTDAYPLAVKEASAETGIDISKFPSENPWTFEQAVGFVPPTVLKKSGKKKRKNS